MTGMGYRPYVPADPAKGLRPGTSLPATPTALPARRRIAVPEAYRRRAGHFRGVSAADLATIVGTAVAFATEAHVDTVGKAIFVGAFAGAGAIGLALACLSLDRFPLRLRASSGWILGLALIVASATVAHEAPAVAVGFVVTGLVQTLGSVVVRDAVDAADRETSRSHGAGADAEPRDASGRARHATHAAGAAAPARRSAAGPPSVAGPPTVTGLPSVAGLPTVTGRPTVTGHPTVTVRPATPALRALRGAVFAGGCAWVVGGIVEATHRNWWLGILAAGLGVLSLRRAPDIGLTTTDARVPASDRASPLAWVLVPLGALGMLARTAWLLGAI